MCERNEAKDPYYLPHLTSPEVGELLRTTDTVILPFGAIEQHGPALPMGTDTLGVIAGRACCARRSCSPACRATTCASRGRSRSPRRRSAAW